MPKLVDALGIHPTAMYRSIQDYLVIYDSKEQILSIRTAQNILLEHKLLNIDLRGVIVSSQSDDEYDFVSRFFVPKCGEPEDPVTGSTHCILVPYWANILGKSKLKAKQLSKRGGELLCEISDDRVLISGKAMLYLQGAIYI